MKLLKIFLVIILISLITFVAGCQNKSQDEITGQLPTNTTRTWIGPEFWANPLQDWQLKDGQIECITSGGFRGVFLLTHEIGSQTGDFFMSLKAKNLNTDSLTEGWIGFEIGIRGEFNDYRDNAIRGRGYPIGITTDGRLFIGKIDSTKKPIPDISLDEITIVIKATQQDDGDYNIFVETNDHASLQQNIITRENISADWIEGGYCPDLPQRPICRIFG